MLLIEGVNSRRPLLTWCSACGVDRGGLIVPITALLALAPFGRSQINLWYWWHAATHRSHAQIRQGYVHQRRRPSTRLARYSLLIRSANGPSHLVCCVWEPGLWNDCEKRPVVAPHGLDLTVQIRHLQSELNLCYCGSNMALPRRES